MSNQTCYGGCYLPRVRLQVVGGLAGRTWSCSGVSSLHHSPSVSPSRRPCPSWAAAAPSKPYSRPKQSQAANTPGVESMSVLQREESQSVAMIANIGAAPIHVKEDLRIDRYAHSVISQNVNSCGFGWLVAARTASTVIVGISL